MITDRTVLTAAHCLDLDVTRDPKYTKRPYIDPYLKVEAGDFTDIYSSKKTIEVIGHKVHPGYDFHTDRVRLDYDIGLIYLKKRPLNRSPIRLCTSKYAQYDINVIGMGMIDPISEAMPDVLQQVRLREHNTVDCAAKGHNYSGHPALKEKTQICLIGDSKDSCFKDSGGPAFPEITNTCLYGIVSRGGTRPQGTKDCGWDGSIGIGIYMRVSAFKNWIEENA